MSPVARTVSASVFGAVIILTFGCSRSQPVPPGAATTAPQSIEIEVTAARSIWKFRYPGPDSELGTADDVFTLNDLYVPSHTEITLQLRVSEDDSFHSFFIPDLRVRQDIVAGLIVPAWLTTAEPNTYPINCAGECASQNGQHDGRIIIQSWERFEASLTEFATTHND